MLKRKRIRASDESSEMEERGPKPERHSTGSQVLTPLEFLSRLSRPERRGRAVPSEIDIAGVIPDDGDFVHEDVPNVGVRDTMVEDG